jgi:hypothetical protein
MVSLFSSTFSSSIDTQPAKSRMEESEHLCHPQVLASQRLVNINAADERVVCYRLKRYRANAGGTKCRRRSLLRPILTDFKTRH